jgi:hypothetical protein
VVVKGNSPLEELKLTEKESQHSKEDCTLQKKNESIGDLEFAQ